jgi:hypothetical protein
MLMRRVGASYERWGKAKMQGVRFEKLTDYRELLSIPKSITHLNWKAERGKGLPVAGNNPSLDSGYSARRMRANVRRCPPLSSSRPRYVPEGKEIQLISPKSRNPVCREATASLKASFRHIDQRKGGFAAFAKTKEPLTGENKRKERELMPTKRVQKTSKHTIIEPHQEDRR